MLFICHAVQERQPITFRAEERVPASISKGSRYHYQVPTSESEAQQTSQLRLVARLQSYLRQVIKILNFKVSGFF